MWLRSHRLWPPAGDFLHGKMYSINIVLPTLTPEGFLKQRGFKKRKKEKNSN